MRKELWKLSEFSCILRMLRYGKRVSKFHFSAFITVDSGDILALEKGEWTESMETKVFHRWNKQRPSFLNILANIFRPSMFFLLYFLF